MAYALNARNQVTLPHLICVALGVKPGDEIDYEVQLDGRIFITASSSRQLPHNTLNIQPLPARTRGQ